MYETRGAGYKKEVETNQENDRKRSVPSYGVQLEQIGDSRSGKEGGRVLTICTHKQAAPAERKGRENTEENKAEPRENRPRNLAGMP